MEGAQPVRLGNKRLGRRKSFSKRAVMQWHSCPGSGGVTVPGGVPEPGAVGTVGVGWG